MTRLENFKIQTETLPNLDIKNPHSGEVADHRAPAEIVDAIIKQEKRILGIMDEIKTVLAERS